MLSVREIDALFCRERSVEKAVVVWGCLIGSAFFDGIFKPIFLSLRYEYIPGLLRISCDIILQRDDYVNIGVFRIKSPTCFHNPDRPRMSKAGRRVRSFWNANLKKRSVDVYTVQSNSPMSAESQGPWKILLVWESKNNVLFKSKGVAEGLTRKSVGNDRNGIVENVMERGHTLGCCTVPCLVCVG